MMHLQEKERPNRKLVYTVTISLGPNFFSDSDSVDYMTVINGTLYACQDLHSNHSYLLKVLCVTSASSPS